MTTLITPEMKSLSISSSLMLRLWTSLAPSSTKSEPCSTDSRNILRKVLPSSNRTRSRLLLTPPDIRSDLTKKLIDFSRTSRTESPTSINSLLTSKLPSSTRKSAGKSPVPVMLRLPVPRKTSPRREPSTTRRLTEEMVRSTPLTTSLKSS